MNPQDSIGFIVRRTGRVLRNMIQMRLKEAQLDITMEQGAVLMRLGQSDGCSQNELTDFLSKDKTTIARLVSNMERNSFLVRVPSENDARVKLLYLTQKGKEEQAKLKGEILEGLSIATKDIDSEELAICKKVLNQMYNNIPPITGEDNDICK